MLVAAVDFVPNLAARALSDQHVQKLILESAQVLDAAIERVARREGVQRQRVVKWPDNMLNHPCVIAHEGKVSWYWLSCHLYYLLVEFRHRRGVRHAYADPDKALLTQLLCSRKNVPDVETHLGSPELLWLFCPGGEPLWQVGAEAISFHRAYYANTKLHFPTEPARWTLRTPPGWLIDAATARGYSLQPAGPHSYYFRKDQ